MASLAQILEWFKTGKYPTQQQFQEAWSSFWHKDEKIPLQGVEGLPEALDQKAEAEQFNKHISEADAHKELFDQKANQFDTFKSIATGIVAGVYKVKIEDFFTVLVHDSPDPVTILLGSDLAGVMTGHRVKIYQAGAGAVTFATNGYTLNTATDEQPKLYGIHSMAEVIVTDAAALQVSMYGKLWLN